ncbi:hypothetical protein D3C81_1586170 [compost metagenome]
MSTTSRLPRWLLLGDNHAKADVDLVGDHPEIRPLTLADIKVGALEDEVAIKNANGAVRLQGDLGAHLAGQALECQ